METFSLTDFIGSTLININTAIDVVQTILPLGTLIIAARGLHTWRLQLKGENKYRLSLDVLNSLAVLLDKIDSFRCPSISNPEEYCALEKNGIDPATVKLGDDRRRQYVYQERWNSLIDQYRTHYEQMSRLKILLNDFDLDVVKGKRIKDHIDDLYINKYQDEYYVHESHNFAEPEKLKWDALHEKNIKILYKMPDIEDEYGESLLDYFTEINRRLRKYIGGRRCCIFKRRRYGN
jgi:hypothetical protein